MPYYVQLVKSSGMGMATCQYLPIVSVWVIVVHAQILFAQVIRYKEVGLLYPEFQYSPPITTTSF